jgi:tripartite ATP-independent transporter DctM subunit
VGSIVAGIATPTESAALGVTASIVIAAMYGSLGFKNFVESVRQTLRLSVMTLFIICGSTTFSQILAFSGATGELATLIIRSDWTPIFILLGMLLILMALGCFMDQVSMMMITMPLYMPIVEQMGYNIVWFGVLVLLVMEISLATPPFGLLLFVVKGAAPDGTTMQQVIVSVLPFILLALLLVAAIIIVPELALSLPRLASG